MILMRGVADLSGDSSLHDPPSVHGQPALPSGGAGSSEILGQRMVAAGRR